jgi:hypothetical protein
MPEGYFVFEEDKENGIPEIRVNRQLVANEEFFLFQLIGYYGTRLKSRILRFDKIIKCDNMNKL